MTTRVRDLIALARECDEASEIAVLAREVVSCGDHHAPADFALALDDHMTVIQDEVIARGDAEMALAFVMQVPDSDLPSLQRVVIEHGDASMMVDFADDVDGADIGALTAAVIETGDAFEMTRMARGVPGVDIDALRRAVIETGDHWGAYEFARDVPGDEQDTAALQEVVIAGGDERVMKTFASAIDGADVEAIEAALARQGAPS